MSVSLPPGLNSSREVLRFYTSTYDSLVDSGQYRPFVLPGSFAPYGIVIAYLLLDHRKSPVLKFLRFPLLVCLCAFAVWSIATVRARTPQGSYGIGITAAWITIWTAAILVFNDCQTDFRRIERRPVVQANSTKLRLRSTPSSVSSNEPSSRPSENQQKYYWQSYPGESFPARIDWVLDLFTSFRGIGWNFQISGIPPAPADVEAALRNTHEKAPPASSSSAVAMSRYGVRRIYDRSLLVRDVAVRLAINYLAIDVVKAFMQHDAYFWGYVDTAVAPTYLPDWFRASPVLIRSYRLLISVLGIQSVLSMVMRLGPLFFAGLLGPRILGLRGEAWLNPPDFYGTLLPPVSTLGLAGWWGGYWHQMFRAGFSAPVMRIQQWLNLSPRSNTGRIIALTVAFVLSGVLHVCGSWTQMGATRPFRGPFLFFVSQGAAIAVQDSLGRVFFPGSTVKRKWWQKSLSPYVRGVSNFVLVHAWLYWTAPLLVDDFARGGAWLLEPLPVSPLRALGFGAKGDEQTWYLLWQDMARWRMGSRWWESGIAL